MRRMVTEAVESYELSPGYSEVTLRGPADLIRAICELFYQQMSDLVEPKK